MPAETTQIPWDGPQVRIIEHQAHAPGHAALLIEERRVLIAGDMLSDVLIPMLNLNGTADPVEDYLAGLRLLEGLAGDVDVVVPGHGSIGGADQVPARIAQDRAYVRALRDADVPDDPGSAHPHMGWTSFLAFMNGNSSTLPEEMSEMGHPGSDRLGITATQSDTLAKCGPASSGSLPAGTSPAGVHSAFRRRPTSWAERIGTPARFNASHTEL